MAEALTEAESALGSTWPNPAVGALLVKDGRVLACGATQAAGGNHAEIECLAKAGARARGSCLYVTLEPCCHHGRTPPCTDAIIRAGVRSVIYAIEDPNPLVSGKGAAALAAAGLEVRGGVLAEEARAIARDFFYFMRTGRPCVTLKYAMTLDGRLALDSGDARWISGEESRAHVHLLRKRTQAILTGGQTVRSDDPRLDCRIAGPAWQPIRIIVTEKGFSPDARLFGNGAPVVIVTSQDAVLNDSLLEKVETVILPKLEPGAIAQALAARGIVSILVEAGPRLLTKFIAAREFAYIFAFAAPLLAGGNTLQSIGEIGTREMQSALRLKGEWKSFGEDMCFQGELPEQRLIGSGNGSIEGVGGIE